MKQVSAFFVGVLFCVAVVAAGPSDVFTGEDMSAPETSISCGDVTSPVQLFISITNDEAMLNVVSQDTGSVSNMDLFFNNETENTVWILDGQNEAGAENSVAIVSVSDSEALADVTVQIGGGETFSAHGMDCTITTY